MKRRATLDGHVRELMQELLPGARAEHIKAWEFLTNPATTMERRRVARSHAELIARDHALVAAHLRARERTSNALAKIVSISDVGRVVTQHSPSLGTCCR